MHDIFGDDNRFPDLDDLPKMPYLEQCLKETLRRFPVVPFIFRYTDHDIHLTSNVILFDSTLRIAIFTYLLYHNRNTE